MAELRQKVLRGGFYLVGRQAIALVVSIVGVTVLVRLIGPQNYGLYTGAASIVFVLTTVATFGLDVYIVRRERDLAKEEYDQAFTLLTISAALVGTATFLGAPPLLDLLHEPRFGPALRVLAFSIPFTLLAAPALASLERALNYRTVALIEMAAQFVYYGVALVLAVLGAGLWSPVVASVSWQVWLLVTTYAAARFRPGFAWRPSLVREMLAYGSSYSLSTWLWQLRGLVNPLVVGHFVGAAGVGFVGLAARLVETSAFVRNVAWRLSIAAFGRVQSELGRFKRVVEEAMALQTLAVAPTLAAIGSLGPWLIPLVFGEKWHPVIRVFPFIALGMILQAVFTMETSALFVLNRGKRVIPVHALHIVFFAGGALFFVPRVGIVGFGFGELVAFGAYVLLDVQMRSVFRVSYRDAVPWVAAFAPPLFSLYVPTAWRIAMWIPFLVIATRVRQRDQVRGYLRDVFVRGGDPSAAVHV